MIWDHPQLEGCLNPKRIVRDVRAGLQLLPAGLPFVADLAFAWDAKTTLCIAALLVGRDRRAERTHGTRDSSHAGDIVRALARLWYSFHLQILSHFFDGHGFCIFGPAVRAASDLAEQFHSIVVSVFGLNEINRPTNLFYFSG